MQQQTGLPPSPNASSFAGLLAALAEPKSKRVPAWNDDELEDDVATLSYERALQAHARYRPVDEGVPAPQTATLGSIRSREVIPDQVGPSREAVLSEAGQARPADVSPNRAPSSSRDRGLKSASITIRLSQAECVQLRTRAAEAGLSISAYLRSCTFEAEALRAEVKETLAQLRTGESSEMPHPPTPDRRSWFHWRTRAQGS
jgi:hypothetical protein